MAEILFRHGASLNAQVDSSGSPVHSAYSHRQWEMVELFRCHGGVIGADTAAIYRQTDLARQMLAGEARGELAEGIVSPGRTLAEDLLDFASSGGDPEIVRMALARIDWPRHDPRWFSFWRGRSISGTTFHGCTRATPSWIGQPILPAFASARALGSQRDRGLWSNGAA
jgi:hypothetical protein